jgi:hypothetical protein
MNTQRVAVAIGTALALNAAIANAGQTCSLPRRPIASADAAAQRVVHAIEVAGLLRQSRLSPDCVSFVFGTNDDEPRYSFEIRERHDALCGGDPHTWPRMFSVHVASDGSMTTDAYDHRHDLPLHCPKRGIDTPEDVVYDFYRWYLDQYLQGRNPMFAQRKQMAQYVSRVIFRKSDKHMLTCDADYFTDSQRHPPMWLNSIDPQRVQIHGDRAKVKLTLGANAIDDSVAKLTVTLKKEDGVWKIMDVHDDAPEHWDADIARDEAEVKVREQAEAQAQARKQQEQEHAAAEANSQNKQADAKTDDPSSDQTKK